MPEFGDLGETCRIATGALLDAHRRDGLIAHRWAPPLAIGSGTMLLLIDNYDSFTYNLVHYLGELGADTVVVRNDVMTVEAAMAQRPSAIVISPGPCDPDRAGICLELVAAASAVSLPVLGVCLGHQAIAQAFGARIVRAEKIMHGKVSHIEHDGTGLFKGLPNPLDATRYHSLCAAQATLPDCLIVNATSEDGAIMGIRHRSLPLHGVQFHPESIETPRGHDLLRNFLDLVTETAPR